MAARLLTPSERELAGTMFGSAIDYDRVLIKRRCWFPLQRRSVIMAPTGHLHVHPDSDLWSEDYSGEKLGLQGLFLHELTHVWQTQTRGRYYLPLMRHPFCRYRYRLENGRRFEDYGLEQQAEILRHAFLLGQGGEVPGAATIDIYRALLPFRPA